MGAGPPLPAPGKPASPAARPECHPWVPAGEGLRGRGAPGFSYGMWLVCRMGTPLCLCPCVPGNAGRFGVTLQHEEWLVWGCVEEIWVVNRLWREHCYFSRHW